MRSNPEEDLLALIDALSMSEEERRHDAVYALGSWIRLDEEFLDDILEDPSVSDEVSDDIQGFKDGEHDAIDLDEETVDVISGRLDLDALISEVALDDPTEVPLWGAASLSYPEIKNGWLAHYTDAAHDIERDGFTRGVADIYQLVLTTQLGEYAKKGPGYNFAFEPSDVDRYARGRDGNKYGEQFVVFHAPYVYIWHYWDEEPQAIFWGPDATSITEVWEEDGYFYIEDEDGDDLDFPSLNALLRYLEGSR